MTLIEQAAQALENWTHADVEDPMRWVVNERIRTHLLPLVTRELDEAHVPVRHSTRHEFTLIRGGEFETFPRDLRLFVDAVNAVNEVVGQLEFRLYAHSRENFDCGLSDGHVYDIDARLVDKDEPHVEGTDVVDTQDCSSFCTHSDGRIELNV